MHTYSLWICPEGEAYQEFKQVIAQLAQQNAAPTFEPHMTIFNPAHATDEEVIATVRQVVAPLTPFEIQLGPVEFSTTYFQCVFVRLKTSAALLNLHLNLKKAFVNTDEHVFMPHASLVYGTFDMVKRESIAQSVKMQTTHFTAAAVTIVRAESKDPKDWEVVGVVKLGEQ